MKRKAFAIKVIWKSGNEEYLKVGLSNTPAIFHSLREAQQRRDFMLMGADDDFQSINVVPYPKGYQ